jgi:hypothetical protein
MRLEPDKGLEFLFQKNESNIIHPFSYVLCIAPLLLTLKKHL